jgi:hypothetical protein
MNHTGKASFSSTNDNAIRDLLGFNELGMDDDTTVLWGDFTWQFAERWQFSFNYSSFDANGFRMATKDGNFGDIDWSVGAALTSKFELEMYIVDFTWDFVKTENAHVGIGLGLHAMDLDLDVVAEVGVDIGGMGGVVEVRQEHTSVLAPLPNISLVGGIMLGENVYLDGHAGYFTLDYDKYGGELISLRGGIEWRPWRNFGFGAAYQYIDLNLKVDGSSSQDRYDLRFHGPILFFSAGF